MVDPARIRNRIDDIVIDEDCSDRGGIFIDFIVDERARWYVRYDTCQRNFSHCRSLPAPNRVPHNPSKLLRDYLISIIPPEIIARCTAASLGVVF